MAPLNGFAGLGVASPQAYALVSMASLLAANCKVPLTAILLMFEYTQARTQTPAGRTAQRAAPKRVDTRLGVRLREPFHGKALCNLTIVLCTRSSVEAA